MKSICTDCKHVSGAIECQAYIEGKCVNRDVPKRDMTDAIDAQMAKAKERKEEHRKSTP